MRHDNHAQAIFGAVGSRPCLVLAMTLALSMAACGAQEDADPAPDVDNVDLPPSEHSSFEEKLAAAIALAEEASQSAVATPPGILPPYVVATGYQELQTPMVVYGIGYVRSVMFDIMLKLDLERNEVSGWLYNARVDSYVPWDFSGAIPLVGSFEDLEKSTRFSVELSRYLGDVNGGTTMYSTISGFLVGPNGEFVGGEIGGEIHAQGHPEVVTNATIGGLVARTDVVARE